MSRQTKWMALGMMFLMGCPKDPEPPGPFEPDGEYGTLIVRSDPSAARVYLDEHRFDDLTPASYDSLNPGTYDLELKKENYEDWSSSVTIAASQTTTVNATMVEIETPPDDSPYDASFERITTGPYTEIPGSWSPDGRMITFVSDRDNDLAIWVVDTMTKELWKPNPDVQYGGVVEHPSFSPDGTTIVYDLSSGYLYTVPVRGGLPTELFDNGFLPAWSPDGTKMAFFGGWDLPEGFGLYTISLMDGTVRQICPLVVYVDVDYVTDLHWSPDGALLAYGNVPTQGKVRQISMVSSEGGTPAPMMPPDEYKEGFFDWYPTGRKIVFSSSRGPGLWTYDLDLQQDPVQLFNEPADVPRWSLDGTKLCLLMCIFYPYALDECNIWVKHF